MPATVTQLASTLRRTLGALTQSGGERALAIAVAAQAEAAAAVVTANTAETTATEAAAAAAAAQTTATNAGTAAAAAQTTANTANTTANTANTKANSAIVPLKCGMFTNPGVLSPGPANFNFTLTPAQAGTFVEINVAINGTTIGVPDAQVVISLQKGATVLGAIGVNAGSANGENFFGSIPFLDLAPATGGHTYTIVVQSAAGFTIPIGGIVAVAKELSPFYTT